MVHSVLAGIVGVESWEFCFVISNISIIERPSLKFDITKPYDVLAFCCISLSQKFTR